MRYSLLILSYLLLGATAIAEDRIELEGTAIIGNQELPKVLYIVPWKPSELPQLNEPPLQTLIDEALAPVDREVFRREVDYHDALASNPGDTK